MSAATLGWCTVPAGRQMDGMVAERVLGWQRARSPYPIGWPGHHVAILVPAGDLAPATALLGDEPLDTQYDNVPRLSTNIAAAWRVLAALHGDTERWASFTTALDITLRGMGAAALHELEVSQAAYGICRAALLAWETTR